MEIINTFKQFAILCLNVISFFYNITIFVMFAYRYSADVS